MFFVSEKVLINLIEKVNLLATDIYKKQFDIVYLTELSTAVNQLNHYLILFITGLVNE